MASLGVEYRALILTPATAEQMPQLFLLCLQIFFRMFRGRDFAGHALGDLNPGAFKRRNFVGIVRKQPHPLNVQRFQNLNRHDELALVGLKSKPLVRFHRVKSAVLKRVGLQFSHQPDAAPLLLLIDKDTRPRFGDHRKRHLKLLPAIATQRAKYVPGKTLRVDAYQRRPRVHLAHHQRNRLFSLGAVARRRCSGRKPVNKKMPPTRREVRGCYLLYLKRTHPQIIAFDFKRSPLRVSQCERRTQSQDHACRRNQRTAVKIKIVNPSPFGAIAQLGERIVRNDEVVGSIPTSSTNLLNGLATIAVISVSSENPTYWTVMDRESLANSESCSKAR